MGKSKGSKKKCKASGAAITNRQLVHQVSVLDREVSVVYQALRIGPIINEKGEVEVNWKKLAESTHYRTANSAMTGFKRIMAKYGKIAANVAAIFAGEKADDEKPEGDEEEDGINVESDASSSHAGVGVSKRQAAELESDDDDDEDHWVTDDETDDDTDYDTDETISEVSNSEYPHLDEPYNPMPNFINPGVVFGTQLQRMSDTVLQQNPSVDAPAQGTQPHDVPAPVQHNAGDVTDLPLDPGPVLFDHGRQAAEPAPAAWTVHGQVDYDNDFDVDDMFSDNALVPPRPPPGYAFGMGVNQNFEDATWHEFIDWSKTAEDAAPDSPSRS
ncbi:hypothetical protein F4808DRAFT_455760 [Astrocystis sublimbata]|nr:hypothetical protein F4808DRAFT_455760 [Astrocystis sublimbata]